MTYNWIFAILKIEMSKTSDSAVKRIGKRFVTKDTLNRKVCSVRPSTFKIKHDHRLKMTFLKGIRKRLLSTTKRIFFRLKNPEE